MSETDPQTNGDHIEVGKIKNGKAIAIGRGATAVYQGLTYDEVVALLAELKNQDQPTVWNGRIPYLGLNAYQEADARYFFGRESLVEELLQRVQQANFITIAGPSGSGKSSVARAGLFHALRQGTRIENSDRWLLATMQPKGNPIEQLAQAIERLTKTPGTGDHLRQNSPENPLALHQQAETLLSEDPNQRFVLLVDQFEELFTQTKDANVRQTFINLLTEAAQAADSRCRILISLRSDFVSNCASHEQLRELISQQFQLVGAMAPRDLAKAITLPALEVGAEIDPKLVSQIIADMKGSPDALPLMSFALRDLFEVEKSKKGEPMDLTLPEYVQRGGLEKALEEHANKVFNNFTDAQKEIAKNIFSKLIEVGQGRVDTRRTATFAELISVGSNVQAVTQVLADLADMRLVITSDLAVVNGEPVATNKQDGTVTIAHEKMIDAWPWLRTLVDENRDFIALQNQINNDAQAWAKNQDAGFLYRGGRLLEVEEKFESVKSFLDARSLEFIQTSLDRWRNEIEEKEAQQKREIEQIQALAEEQRQRAEAEQRRSALFRRALIGGSVLLTFLLIAVIFAGIQTNTAINKEAVAQSGSLAMSSITLGHENGMRALLLAIAAGQQADTTLAFTALHTRLPFMSTQLQTFSHEDWIDGAVWNKDESQILTWSLNGTAVLWATASGERLQTLSHEDSVWGVLWNEDESQILTWSGDGTAVLWAAASGERLQTLLHEASVRGALWNKDESQILTWSSDGTAVLWAAASGERLQTLLHEASVRGALWNKDESQILTWSSDGTAVLWAAASGERLQTLSYEASGALWNKDESQILTWSDDGTAVLWAVASGERLQTLSHEDSVWGAVWNKDESQILTWSSDGTAVLWAAASGERLQTLSHEDSVWGAVWNEDESQILTWSGDGTAVLWAAAGGERLQTLSHEDSISGAVWNEDESQILTWSSDGTAALWAAASGGRLQTLSHDSWVRGAIWNEDESRILTWSSDGMVALWEAMSKARLQILSHEDTVLGAAWNEDESQIFTMSLNKFALWDVASGERLQVSSDEAWTRGAVWMENDDQILKSSNDTLWNKDENQILTFSNDEMAVLLTAASGEQLQTFSHTDKVIGAVWNKNESQILTWSRDGTAALWEVRSGEQLQAFPHSETVWGATWNEDESQILTWSFDGTVKVWNVKSGQPLLIINPDGTPITDAHWNQDEDRLLIATGGGTVRTYYANMADLIGVACQLTTRNFTWGEWQVYFPGEPYQRTCAQWPSGTGAPPDAPLWGG